MVDSPGPIAQLAEQQPFKLLVPSSSLGGLTNAQNKSNYFGC